MKKIMFLQLSIFLFVLIFPSITDKIGYQIRAILQFQRGSIYYDFKVPYKYSNIKDYRQKYSLIAQKLVYLSEELEKRKINLYPVFLEISVDNNQDVLNSLQSKIYKYSLNQDILQFKKIYTNISVFSYNIMQENHSEFTNRCEYRWIIQDAHGSPKLSFYTYKTMIEKIRMKHNWSNVQFKKHTDKHSTELLAFISDTNIIRLYDDQMEKEGKNRSSNRLELAKLQKYFTNPTNFESYQYFEYPKAINTNSILIFGDSFSLTGANYFSLFKKVYFIRINRLYSNHFDLNKFLIDHPDIKNIIMQLSQGTSVIYHEELQKLVNNLQK